MYYGRHEGNKPKNGVHAFMIDEYIKKIMEKRIVEFHKQVEKEIVRIRKEFPELKKIHADILQIKESLSRGDRNKKRNASDEI